MIFMNDDHQTLVMFMILLDDLENDQCEKKEIVVHIFSDVYHLGYVDVNDDKNLW